ncbi:MAG: putative Ig domain-containing protein [Nanoarchaeota archaeon]
MKSNTINLLVLSIFFIVSIFSLAGSAQALTLNFQDKVAVADQQLFADLSNEISGVLGTVSFTLTANPQGLVVTNNGLMAWTPTPSQVGMHTVKLTVTDGVETKKGSFYIEVLPQSGISVNFQNKIATVGQILNVDLSQDVTSINPVSYDLINGPGGMTISTNGMLDWTPTSAGIYAVEVEVTDTVTSATASDTFDVEVQPAAPPNPDMELNQSDMLFGGPDGIRGDVYTKQVILDNTGNDDLTNIQVDLLGKSGSSLASKYSASTILGSTSLLAGQSTTIDVEMTIPDDTPIFEHRIGRLEVTGDTASTTLTRHSDLNMQAESLLRIEEVEVEINGDDDTVNHGDDVEVKVDDEVIVHVTLENRYGSSTNIELEDAYFEMDDDGDWDLDLESDESDIDNNDEETFEVSFTVPNDVDDDDVEVLIEAFAEDEDYGFEHADEFMFYFELDRESHEIIIDDWSFSQDPVDCQDGYVDLDVTLKNTGKNDEDEVLLNAMIDDMGFTWQDRVRDISIDEHEDEQVRLSVPLEDDMKEGSYFVNLEAFYDNNDLSDDRSAFLEVTCEQDDANETGGGVVIIGDDENESQQEPAPTPNPVYGEETSPLDDFRSSTGYLVVLIVIGLSFLIAIAYLFRQVVDSDR